MKIYHYVILFVVFAVTLGISVDVITSGQSALNSEKRELVTAIDRAIVEGTEKMAEYGGVGYDKEAVINTYFTSLYASLGVMGAHDTKELLQVCTPVILLTESDGFSIFYHEMIQNGAGKHIRVTRYAPKVYYSYDDGTFVYSFTQASGRERFKCRILDKNRIISGGTASGVYEIDVLEIEDSPYYDELWGYCPASILFDPDAFDIKRGETIAKTIERELGYYCSHHNHVAEESGFSYIFSVPEVESKDLKTLNDAGMIVVFQGYPYDTGRGYFNRVCFSAANVMKRETYYCDMLNLCYHKEGCPGITEEMEKVHTLYDAAAKGLYPCNICGKH